MAATATIRRLSTRSDRLRADQAALLRGALLPFERDMPDAVRAMVAYIDQQTAARNGWTFLMLSPDQNRAVVRWLRAHSSRPMCAAVVWAELFSAVDRDTGEILLSRDQLAALAGIAVQHVSNVMTELESIGAISRRREKVVGMRGPGRTRYFMNPLVGTHLGGSARDQAQADAPPGPLRVLAGGRAV